MYMHEYGQVYTKHLEVRIGTQSLGAGVASSSKCLDCTVCLGIWTPVCMIVHQDDSELSRPPLSFILRNLLSSSNTNFYVNYWIPHLQGFFHKSYSFAEFLIHIMNYFLNIESSAFTWISFSYIIFTLKNSFLITSLLFFFLWGLVLNSYYAQLLFNHFSCDFLVRLQYLADQVSLPFYK